MLNTLLNILFYAAESFYLNKKCGSSILKTVIFVIVSNLILGIMLYLFLFKGPHIPFPAKNIVSYGIMGLIYGFVSYVVKFLLAKFVFKIKIADQFDYGGLVVIFTVAISLSTL